MILTKQRPNFMTSSIDIIIEPRKRDLGGFSVGRILPYAKRRMVGPFIFLDEMGPAVFPPHESGIDVRPHPHIGLATVTYLMDGEIQHRDNLGFDQIIKPGDVNWMTAGRGIVHSERTEEATKASGQKIHGLQSWIALPEADETTAPAFHHHPKATLPEIDEDGVRMRLIAGDAFGEASPVKTFSPMFYLAVNAPAGGAIPIPTTYEDRAIYIVDGVLDVDGVGYDPGRLIVFRSGANPTLKATTPVTAMLLGGAPLGERLIWWNLVATRQELIDEAKDDWRQATQSGFQEDRQGLFALPPGEEEFIPLPDE